MDINSKILSDIVIYSKYARYDKRKFRRETWDEIVTRNKAMHLKKFKDTEILDEIEEAYKFVYDKKILPSMRSLQFAGKAMEVNPVRGYNCSFVNVNHWAVFPELMFLLLSGTGVGISVQKHHVNQLPRIKKPDPDKHRRFLIEDSIQGWADAIKQLVKSYYGLTTSTIRFDFSDIREKGAELMTAGGKAPGPQPLKECLIKIEGVLSNKEDGERLEPIEIHDIACYIAESVLAGGIRRSAIITFFSKDDLDMMSAKTGTWYEKNPQRALSNNSVMLDRKGTSMEEFFNIWEYSKNSGSGEPGFMWTDDRDWGANPCLEISLPDMGLCNLVEINASNIIDEEDFKQRAWAAALIATLQAAYTDFHYLRDGWKRNAEKEALIGVSMTGIASMEVFKYDMKDITEVVKNTNTYIAEKIGINPAARTTAVKPAGTTSLVLGTSSGIHAWHSKYFLRRIRVNKDEPLYAYLERQHPELLEDEYFNPQKTSVITVPLKAPENAVTRDESALELLARVMTISRNWVHPGHVSGPNRNNVSCTINIKDDEWDKVRDWMWMNRDSYTGISILPYDGGSYKQTPFEECSEEEYNDRSKILRDVDLSKIVELSNFTSLQSELACSGPTGCEVT